MITVSENAVKQLKLFQQDEGMATGGLRISIVGGGCSGLSYKLDFQKEPQENDKIFEMAGVRVFIDPKSFLYVKGLELDYSGGLNGTGFVFKNPNANKSCGCGTSFSV